MSRLCHLALVLLLLAVSGCGPADSSLLGQPLRGSVFTSLDKVGVIFDFEALGTDVDACPFLNAGAVSFDGVVNDEPIDFYQEQRFLIARSCGGLFLLFDLDTPDVARNAELVVHSGANDDVVRYEAIGLHANRRLEVQGSTTVASGGTLQVKYMTPDDEFAPVTADVGGSQLPVSKVDDVIDIVIPTWLPAGDHDVDIKVPYSVATSRCEGFESCAVTGTISQTVSITVDG